MNSEHVLVAPMLELQRLPRAARRVLRLLQRLDGGRLELRLPDGQLLHCGPHRASASLVQLRLHDWSVFDAVLTRGDIGFGESYVDGLWSTSDLPALLSLLLANRDQLLRLLHGSWLGTLLARLRHLLRGNTRAGSRSNIRAHYDIGNPFYQLWLDPGMTYSSAWFDRPELTLAQAQQAKLDRVLAELGVESGQRVLEIGCGWGSWAETAARSGVRVDGLSLSREQLDYGRERLQRNGLDALATLHMRDYRDLDAIAPVGGWDGVASIEMFEAVGREYWPAYFRTVATHLKPGGFACVQTITIDDALFEHYAKNTDFIQQYIFPGGMLPSRSAFLRQAEEAGLELVREHAFGADYATTLALWRQRFLSCLPQVEAQGYDARFQRLWEFYLAYCEAGFDARSLDVVQFTLRRPQRSPISGPSTC